MSDDDECVIDTCRFFTGTAAEGNLERGYMVQCVRTDDEHDCGTEPRVLFMDSDVVKA